MFINNYTCLPSNILWVNKETKNYLESNGFCVLSYKDGQYAFTQSDNLLSILLKKGGTNG